MTLRSIARLVRDAVVTEARMWYRPLGSEEPAEAAPPSNGTTEAPKR